MIFRIAIINTNCVLNTIVVIIVHKIFEGLNPLVPEMELSPLDDIPLPVSDRQRQNLELMFLSIF